MTRRSALAALAGLSAACASADRLTFDRGGFAIVFTKLMTIGLGLLNAAIQKGTRAGVPNAHAQELATFRDRLLVIQEQVEKQIMDAPARADQINTGNLQAVVDILAKAMPLILPLLAL